MKSTNLKEMLVKLAREKEARANKLWTGKGKFLCIPKPSREEKELFLSSSYNNQTFKL